MEALVIRNTKVDELNDITDCVKAAFQKYIERIGKEPKPMLYNYLPYIISKELFTAEYNGQVAGMILLLEREDHMLLDVVAVLPEYQGKGIGKSLLEFADEYSVERGFKEIKVCTNVMMTENIAMYTKFGYIEYERAIEDGYNRVFFRKKLD